VRGPARGRLPRLRRDAPARGAVLRGVRAPHRRGRRRAARARAVREQAAKAAPKIQLVIALLLVPAVLLLVGAALAAAFGAA